MLLEPWTTDQTAEAEESAVQVGGVVATCHYTGPRPALDNPVPPDPPVEGWRLDETGLVITRIDL